MSALAVLAFVLGLIVGAAVALIWSVWTLTRGMER